MKKSWQLIPKILSGEKTIESRWYQSRRTPWDRIQAGDTVYFKNSGEQVTAVARVSAVLQFRIQTIADAKRIVHRYGKAICLVNKDPDTWSTQPNYCVLVFLKDPRKMQPFSISKQGFGISSAWITVPAISRIKVSK